MYYKDAAVACMVYDITNLNSFKALEYWFKELKAHANENISKIIAFLWLLYLYYCEMQIVKVMIGNKTDLASQTN